MYSWGQGVSECLWFFLIGLDAHVYANSRLTQRVFNYSGK